MEMIVVSLLLLLLCHSVLIGKVNYDYTEVPSRRLH